MSDPLPEPQITDIPDALLVPPQPGPLSPHGVFDAQGRFCDLSRARLSRGRMTATPIPVAPEQVIAGHHAYLGQGRLHFGHFLLESFARVWALERLSGRLDGLILLPFGTTGTKQWVVRKYAALWSAVSDGMPMVLQRKPARVERLSLPSPGFGHGTWLRGTPDYRAFVRARLSAAFAPDGPERLYISRAGLTDQDKQVLGEDRIESAMAAAGYTLFRPEDHSLEVQCARYAAARFVVGADGSAFHLAPFLLQPQARAAIYLRRDRGDILRLLGWQMQSFAGIDPLLIDARLDRNPATEAAPARIDPEQVISELAAHGFL